MFLNKSVEIIKERVTKLFEETPFLLGPKMLGGVVAVALFAPLLVILYSVFLFNQESALNEKMQVLEKKVKSLALCKSQQEGFIREFGSSSVSFLQDNIEVIQPLNEEIEFLTRLEKLSDYEPIKNRLRFLTGEENQIHFIPETKRESNYYIETEWKLEHPIEASAKDVNHLISLIEGAKPNSQRPQLIIKKFSLKAKGDEVYYLDLDILQRSLHEKD